MGVLFYELLTLDEQPLLDTDDRVRIVEGYRKLLLDLAQPLPADTSVRSIIANSMLCAAADRQPAGRIRSMLTE